ncbi:MAG: hypothetical protein JXB00_18325 [Bacteroidales bacterium]|nr:hypothetical protein [Bacteroidales bacterium]
MDYKHTIDILSENIKELAVIVNGFAENQSVPALELDLVLAKTRNLYDVLLMLKKYAVNDTVATTDKSGTSLVPPKSEDKPVIKPTESEIGNEHTEIDKEIEPLPHADEKKPDLLKPESDNAEPPKILSDRFKKQPASLHDNLFQSKTFYDLSAKLQSKPLANISEAIGINERFLFIRELFQGSVEKYNHTLEFLNNAHDFNEAYNYLVENFQWDMDSEAVQKILELIRRKFITGKNG